MLKKAGVLTVIRVTGDLVNLLLFIVLSRHFGPEGIGHYAYAMAIAGLVYSLVSLGLEDLAIRECAGLDREERSDFLGNLLAFQLAIALAVLALLLGYLAVRRPGAQELAIVLVLCAYQFAFGFSRTLFAPAFSQQAMIGPSVAELLSRAGIVAASIGLIAWGRASLPVALSPYPVGGLLLLLSALVSARRWNGAVRVSATWGEAMEMARAAWPFGAAIIIFTLQGRISFVLLSTLLGQEATGFYASSYKFLEFGVLPLVFLGLTVYPGMSRAYPDDLSAFRVLADRLFRLSLLGGGLLGWGMVFVIPHIIGPVLGESFTPAVPYLKMMGILGLLMGVEIPVVRLMQAAQMQQARVTCMALGVLLNIVLALVLIPMMGIPGAITATVAGQAAITFLSLGVFRRRFASPLERRPAFAFTGGVFAALAGGWIGQLTAGTTAAAAASMASALLVLAGTGFFGPLLSFAPAAVGAETAEGGKR